MPETVPMSDQPAASSGGDQPSAEALRTYADKVAPGWQIVHKPESRSTFGLRIDSTWQSLDQLFRILDARPKPTHAPGEAKDPLLELRENPRLLRSPRSSVSKVALTLVCAS